MTLDEWLEKEFFPVIDTGRLERGQRLYREGKIVDLEEREKGFFAAVKGTRGKIYKLDAYVPVDENGIPDIEEMSIDCSCPDWVEFCKHAVCAVIRYCDEQTAFTSTLPKSAKAEDVRKAITRNMEQIVDLGPLPFLREGGNLENMHRIVQKKLRNHSF